MVICSFDLNCTLLDNASRKIWPFGMTQVQELKLSCLFHFRFPASLCCLLVKCLAICERHLTIVCTQNVVGDEFISRLSTLLLDLVWTFCGLSKALSVSVLTTSEQCLISSYRRLLPYSTVNITLMRFANKTCWLWYYSIQLGTQCQQCDPSV